MNVSAALPLTVLNSFWSSLPKYLSNLVLKFVVSVATIPALRRFWEDNISRPISGTVVKTVGSDEDYLKFVEKEAFDGYGGYISTATNVYGTLLDTTKNDTCVEASLSFLFAFYIHHE